MCSLRTRRYSFERALRTKLYNVPRGFSNPFALSSISSTAGGATTSAIYSVNVTPFVPLRLFFRRILFRRPLPRRRLHATTPERVYRFRSQSAFFVCVKLTRMREAATTPVISWQVSQHQLQSLRDVNNAADMFVCGECPDRFCKEALLCFLFVFCFCFHLSPRNLMREKMRVGVARHLDERLRPRMFHS